MMILQDNTNYSSTADNLEELLSLQRVANRKIADLLDENGNNLLIYPHSFYRCEDETDQQQLFVLHAHWKEKQCTKVLLETGNVAGFIGVNGLSVSIHSRFSPNVKEDFFLHYMLRKVLHFNMVNLPHGTTDEPAFDFLLYLFPQLLNEALVQGIYKEYQRNEYNDAHVRGNINIHRHLITNLPFNGRIAYRTREFSYDNPVTELIRHTIEYISQTEYGQAVLENDPETRSNVAQILSATPRYNRLEREQIIKRNRKIINHPYYSRYTPLQRLCVQILKHETIKYGAKKDQIYGILFDVAYLWEEYLATILTRQGFQHPNNRKSTTPIYLATYRLLPRYPDFYREQDRIIIDAKYKKETNRNDVHQMIAYMYRLRGKYGIFLQPCSRPTQPKDVHLLGYGTENDATLQTYLYPIPHTVDGYQQFAASMRESEHQLVQHFIHDKP